MARARLRDGGRNTLLDTTALVHESYLRFVRAGALRAADRRAFYAYASQVMRTVIINSARDRLATTRGAAWTPLTLSSDAVAGIADGERILLAVHEALQDLAQVDARLAQVVEMRHFGGFSEDEIAETLGFLARTVRGTRGAAHRDSGQADARRGGALALADGFIALAGHAASRHAAPPAWISRMSSRSSALPPRRGA